jgi:hypothetical protein
MWLKSSGKRNSLFKVDKLVIFNKGAFMSKIPYIERTMGHMIEPSEFDLVVLGTGLIESIVAA